jgi:hypothetical protein
MCGMMLRANKVGVYKTGNVQSDPTSELRLQIDNSLYNNLEYDLTQKYTDGSVYLMLTIYKAQTYKTIHITTEAYLND